MSEELLAAADRQIDEVTAQEGDAGQAGWFLPRQRLRRYEDVLRLSPAASIAGAAQRSADAKASHTGRPSSSAPIPSATTDNQQRPHQSLRRGVRTRFMMDIVAPVGG